MAETVPQEIARRVTTAADAVPVGREQAQAAAHDAAHYLQNLRATAIDDAYRRFTASNTPGYPAHLQYGPPPQFKKGAAVVVVIGALVVSSAIATSGVPAILIFLLAAAGVAGFHFWRGGGGGGGSRATRTGSLSGSRRVSPRIRGRSALSAPPRTTPTPNRARPAWRPAS